jgi:hypothetical protein
MIDSLVFPDLFILENIKPALTDLLNSLLSSLAALEYPQSEAELFSYITDQMRLTKLVTKRIS